MKAFLALIIICLVLPFAGCTSTVFAANNVYIDEGTTRTWTNTGGDELLDLGGLAADNLRMGSYHDLGAAPRSEWYRYEMYIDKFATAPVIGEGVELWWSGSDDTDSFDGQPVGTPTNTVEGSILEDHLTNLILADIATVGTTTAADAKLKVSGIIRLIMRYVSPVVHNATADALNDTVDLHTVTLTAIAPQIQ